MQWLSDEEAGAGEQGLGEQEAGCVSLCGLRASPCIPATRASWASCVASGNWRLSGLSGGLGLQGARQRLQHLS